MRLASDFSSETVAARRQEADVFQVLKKNCQLRILYLSKLAFENKKEMEMSPDT